MVVCERFQSRFSAPIISRIVSFTPLGAIPSGAPLGEAALLLAALSLNVTVSMSDIIFLMTIASRRGSSSAANGRFAEGEQGGAAVAAFTADPWRLRFRWLSPDDALCL